MYYKIIFEQSNGSRFQIRKFEHDGFLNFEQLCNKVKGLCPELSEDFTLLWSDKEDDLITMCNTEELLIAKQQYANKHFKDQINGTGAEFTVYVKGDIGKRTNFEINVHSHVVCDNCDQTIVGFRYKCIQCNDFDLCMQCEKSGLHGNHWMIRILKPVSEYQNLILDFIIKAIKNSGLNCADSYNSRLRKKCYKSCIRNLASVFDVWHPDMNDSNKNEVETNNDTKRSSEKLSEQKNIKQNATTLEQNGATSKQNDTAPKQNDTKLKQNSTTLKQNSTTLKQNSTTLEQNSRISEQNVTLPEQNGTIPEQNGTIPEQNGTIPEQNGTIPEQNGAIPDLHNVFFEFTKNIPSSMLHMAAGYLLTLLDDSTKEHFEKLQKEEKLTTDTLGNETSSMSNDIVTSIKNATSPVNTLTEEWTIVDKSETTSISSASSVSSNLDILAENNVYSSQLPTVAATSVATAPLTTTATASAANPVTANASTANPVTANASAANSVTANASTANPVTANASAANSVTATTSQENSPGNIYPELPIEQTVHHPDPNIQNAIENISAMGFPVNIKVLTSLVESANGDVGKVLDILS
ncbi:refractory to sigma P [Augochlora pura]